MTLEQSLLLSLADSLHREVEDSPVRLSDLSIRTKDKRLIAFAPNEVQTMYLDMLTEAYEGFDWRNGVYTLRGAREDILKARQEGMSTLWLALYFLDTINTPLTQTIIIAHDAESTERLFQIVKRFHEHLPAAKKRPTRYNSRRELHFHDIDSVIYVGTAGSGRVGRGGTVNNVHMSERAFWDRGDEIETGLLESVPMEGNATRETTANGLNEYYEEYQRSKRGESRFRARFFGWNLQKEYRLEQGMGMGEPSDTRRSEGVPSPEEQQLSDAYGLDAAQLLWRREKIKDLKEKFPQEYPINDVEAFLASGNPRFKRHYLKRLLDSLYETDESGQIRLHPDHTPVMVETPATSQWSGTVTTYVEAEPDRHYLVTADVSEGLNKDGRHDNSVAHVYDRQTWEQVCVYETGTTEPYDYAIDLANLGHLYNHAVIAVERNNHGHAVLATLERVCHYGGLHSHRHYDEQGKEDLKVGFPTTGRSKLESVGELAGHIEAMEDGEEGFWWHHSKTIEELIHYIKIAGGKTEAEAGNDDHITCCWIAAALMHDYAIRPQPIHSYPDVPKPRYGQTRRQRR